MADEQPLAGEQQESQESSPAAGETQTRDWEREARANAKEAQQMRARLRDLEQQAEQRKQAEMSDLEKAQTEAKKVSEERDRLKTEAQSARFEAAVVREATKTGIDPTLAARLITPEFDEAGRPQGVADALGALVKEHPYLAAGATTTALTAATNAARQRGTTTGTYTREQIGDPKFFADNKAAIMQAVRENRITD